MGAVNNVSKIEEEAGRSHDDQDLSGLWAGSILAHDMCIVRVRGSESRLCENCGLPLWLVLWRLPFARVTVVRRTS